jgi:hypothetical protein
MDRLVAVPFLFHFLGRVPLFKKSGTGNGTGKTAYLRAF